MRKTTMAIVLAATIAANGVEELVRGTRKMPTAEKRAEIYQRYRQRQTMKEGGIVVRPDPMRKRVVLMDVRSEVPRHVLDAVAAEIARSLSIEVDVLDHDGGFDTRLPENALQDQRIGLLIVFAHATGFPTTLLVAPESRWAVIDTGRLAADKNAGKLEERVHKETLRALAIAGGAANTLHGECLLRPVENLSDLDHLKARTLSPEPLMRMREHMTALGIRPVVSATYRRACQEGWAPAPTNDVQRAIWEQVRADKERGPAKPITIRPPGT